MPFKFKSAAACMLKIVATLAKIPKVIDLNIMSHTALK
jgi:hypothetical protein